MPDVPRERTPFLGLPPWSERRAVSEALRTETVGGLVLLVAAVVALVWANSPWSGAYESVRETRFGIAALGLDLSVGHWASDGLLTVFFLVAGIELKRELVVGEMRTPAKAVLPVVAAVCGMAVPAVLYVIVSSTGGGSLSGWAVPMATDIAFALAVLAVLSTSLPSALRAFLLTLAVVDDLGAILVIAVFFPSSLDLLALAGAACGLGAFYVLQRKRVRGWWWYASLGVAIWALMYNGGIHATVAGVAMGLILRATPGPRAASGAASGALSPGDRTAHLLRPFSAGVAVPLFALFALFAAGTSISLTALGEVFTRPEPLGVVVGLVLGKTAGIFAGTYLAARFTRAWLNLELAWADVFALAVLAGIGFTVALLIGELAFPDPHEAEHIRAAVLTGSLIAAAISAVLLKRRDRVYRRLCEEEERDTDADGIPDIHRREQGSARCLRREQLPAVTGWLALTAAAVWAGAELSPYWLQFACLIAATAFLRTALHTLRPRTGHISPGRRFGGGRAVVRLKQPATGEAPDHVRRDLTAALDPPPSVLEISLAGVSTLGTEDAQVYFAVLCTAWAWTGSSATPTTDH
ncbi:Na+/H+ antiporter NhaA [Streptomyces halstedii]|uniref:Na(+)/H(+) antiporter NhaA n=1 Tax=Streptomyces halstedii TaxID=1944 RepID=A0A6N9U8Y1_STRHA|nr:Na+/H+ antiporter NhaA [Streptomyces halstedii]